MGFWIQLPSQVPLEASRGVTTSIKYVNSKHKLKFFTIEIKSSLSSLLP